MKIKFNNKEIEVTQNTTLNDFLVENNIDSTGIATAVNNKVVRKTDRETYVLQEGDNILIIKAFYGG